MPLRQTGLLYKADIFNTMNDDTSKKQQQNTQERPQQRQGGRRQGGYEQPKIGGAPLGMLFWTLILIACFVVLFFIAFGSGATIRQFTLPELENLGDLSGWYDNLDDLAENMTDDDPGLYAENGQQTPSQGGQDQGQDQSQNQQGQSQQSQSQGSQNALNNVLNSGDTQSQGGGNNGSAQGQQQQGEGGLLSALLNKLFGEDDKDKLFGEMTLDGQSANRGQSGGGSPASSSGTGGNAYDRIGSQDQSGGVVRDILVDPRTGRAQYVVANGSGGGQSQSQNQSQSQSQSQNQSQSQSGGGRSDIEPLPLNFGAQQQGGQGGDAAGSQDLTYDDAGELTETLVQREGVELVSLNSLKNAIVLDSDGREVGPVQAAYYEEGEGQVLQFYVPSGITGDTDGARFQIDLADVTFVDGSDGRKFIQLSVDQTRAMADKVLNGQ